MELDGKAWTQREGAGWKTSAAPEEARGPNTMEVDEPPHEGDLKLGNHLYRVAP